MFVVRPVDTADIPTLESFASSAMPGVHTFPRTRKSIERAVERSLASFSAQPDAPGDESYLFVLQAVADKTVAGAAAISATAGASGTFFAFRKDVLNQVSRDLNISHNVHALSLCSDLTSHSQLSSFYIKDRRNAGLEADLLSRSRVLFAAIAPHRFGERFFSSMSGVTDTNGRSAFWEALGRKFFQMDFLEAERMIEGARNRTLIVELMPHYPVYVPLLPDEAQAALGKVHANGELPFRILTEEGFERDEYVDIFDGGPVLRAHRNALRCYSHSLIRTALVTPGQEDGLAKGMYLIAANREENFRSVVAECTTPEMSECVALTQEVLQALDVVQGDSVVCVRV